MAEDVNKVIETQAAEAVALQNDISAKIAALKDQQDQVNATWNEVEAKMIEHDIKSIKGDFGSLTIAERTTYKAFDLTDVPPRFIKKVLDSTKVAAQAKLTNELPKGVTSSVTKYLTKRLK